MSKKKKVSEMKKMFISFLSLSLLGLMIKVSFLWASYSGAMDLSHIKFSETKILDVSNYKSLLSEITNKKSKELNLYEISTLIESHPYVKYARVSRHYPSEIKIEIIERIDNENINLKIICGKGCYVRSLARDLGNELGCFAHAKNIRRTEYGPFNLKKCVHLDFSAQSLKKLI